MTVSEQTYRAGPDAVWAALADPTTYPRWLTGAKHMRWVDPAFPAPGTDFGHAVGAGPLEVDDTTTAVEATPGRHLRLHVRARPLLEADVDFDLEPVAGGTRVRMTERPTGRFRVLAPVLAPLVRLRNDRSLRNLAAFLDG